MEDIAGLELKHKYLLRLRTAAGFIAAIIQRSVAYFAPLKNYNWFNAILVVEVTVHILVVGGAGNAELMADSSVTIDDISGRMVHSSSCALGHFLAVCIYF